MTKSIRPPFIRNADFIENAFQRRYQGFLARVRAQTTWHCLDAVPGSGKSWGIRDYVGRSGACKQRDGHSKNPVVAIRGLSGIKTVNAIATALAVQYGVAPSMKMDQRRGWVVEEAARTGLDQLIIDDAHEMSDSQIGFIKEFTDNLEALPYQRRISVVFVSASIDGLNPLKGRFESKQIYWCQMRRRLDPKERYCRILGHTVEELGEICLGFEIVYQDQFPDLVLHVWADYMYQRLTDPRLDPDGTRRVSMDNITKLITISLETAYAAGLTNITSDILKAAADVLVFGGDKVGDIDGEPDVVDGADDEDIDGEDEDPRSEGEAP